jgi:hypothetical protein
MKSLNGFDMKVTAFDMRRTAKSGGGELTGRAEDGKMGFEEK